MKSILARLLAVSMLLGTLAFAQGGAPAGKPDDTKKTSTAKGKGKSTTKAKGGDKDKDKDAAKGKGKGKSTAKGKGEGEGKKGGDDKGGKK